MNEIIVIGHINPDTDSVISAKIFSLFMEQNSKKSIPRIAGDVNKETKFIFSYFKEEIPKKVTEKEINERKFFLVDHNDIEQSVAMKESICGVLDHHHLSGFKTEKPLYFRIEPIGSTSSLVYKIIKEENKKINTKEAGLLLSGIISDTLNLSSPTTTKEDIDFYHELSEISKIDPNTLAEKMFEAKSDFSGKSIMDIIYSDLKTYDFGGNKIGIGVSETTSPSYFKNNTQELINTLKEVKNNEKYKAFFFGVVDIINKNTFLFPAGEEEANVISKVFQGEKRKDCFFLKGISSRKKEISPPLSKYYEKE